MYIFIVYISKISLYFLSQQSYWLYHRRFPTSSEGNLLHIPTTGHLAYQASPATTRATGYLVYQAPPVTTITISHLTYQIPPAIIYQPSSFLYQVIRYLNYKEYIRLLELRNEPILLISTLFLNDVGFRDSSQSIHIHVRVFNIGCWYCKTKQRVEATKHEASKIG